MEEKEEKEEDATIGVGEHVVNEEGVWYYSPDRTCEKLRWAKVRDSYRRIASESSRHDVNQ